MRKTTRTLRWSWGSASPAEAGLVPIAQRASPGVRSVTWAPGPRSVQFLPHCTRTGGRRQRPQRSPGAGGTHAARWGDRDPRPSRGMETPVASRPRAPSPRRAEPGRVGEADGSGTPAADHMGRVCRRFPAPRAGGRDFPRHGDGGRRRERTGCPGPRPSPRGSPVSGRSHARPSRWGPR